MIKEEKTAMRKLTALLLLSAMILSLFGCGNKNAAPEETKEEIMTEAKSSDTKEAKDKKENKEDGPEDEQGEADEYGEPEICPTDFWEAFISLVEKYDGFEIAYSRTWDREVYAGGKDGAYWLMEKMEDGSIYTHYAEGSGTDFAEYLYYTGDGVTNQIAYDINTLTAITENFVYYGQDVITDNPRVPMDVENEGISCSRYEYNFGEYAYDIAKEYGVTVRYSNINDEDGGFTLEYIHTGSDVEKAEKPEAGFSAGNYDDPEYWQGIFGFNYCPFYVSGGPKEYPTFYFRDGGSFIQWLNTEMNTEGFYYYNDRVITKDGKYATEPEFDDSFSSCCEFVMTPYDGPTLSEEEQAEIKKGVVYALHSWTPLKFASWNGIAFDGKEYPSEELECSLSGIRADFCDQEEIDVYMAGRMYLEEEEEYLDGHVKLYVFPHREIGEYNGGVLTEEDIGKAMYTCDYQLRKNPDAGDTDEPIFSFSIPSELDGEAFYGDVDVLFTYDNVIAYYVVVTSHEAGWTP